MPNGLLISGCPKVDPLHQFGLLGDSLCVAEMEVITIRIDNGHCSSFVALVMADVIQYWLCHCGRVNPVLVAVHRIEPFQDGFWSATRVATAAANRDSRRVVPGRQVVQMLDRRPVAGRCPTHWLYHVLATVDALLVSRANSIHIRFRQSVLVSHSKFLCFSDGRLRRLNAITAIRDS